MAVLSVRVFAGFSKPFVFVGAVVDHQIHKYVHIAFFRLCDQALHIRHGAEAGIDAVVIGNIIALVGQRRAIAGRQPEDIHTQLFQVIQFADNAGNIPDAVAVGIIKLLG